MKHLAARASLQHLTKGHILTPQQLFQQACSNVPGITFKYVSSESVVKHEKDLEQRLKNLRTIAGTCTHHCFFPQGGELKMLRVSSDKSAVHTQLEEDALDLRQQPEVQPGKYMVAVYDHDWYLG